MADLFTHGAVMRPLDISHQGVAACLAVYLAEGYEHYELTSDFQMLQLLLPQAHGDGAVAERLVIAARGLIEVFAARADTPKIDLLKLIRVREDVQLAVATYYRQRAAATYARIFPETQDTGAAHAAE